MGRGMDQTKGTGGADRCRFITIGGYNSDIMYYEPQSKTICKIADGTELYQAQVKLS